MVWESCIIILNSDATGSFYSGDTVTGSVVIEFKHEQQIEYINFEVIGICKAQWTRPRPTMPYIQIYSEKDEILKFSINVFKELQGKNVPPSVQTFYFHFTLPTNLPSTFESSIGKVFYLIKIRGKAAYKLKKVKSVPFMVQEKINVNHLDNFLFPIQAEAEKILRNSKKVYFSVKTYKAFCPQQTIPFEVLIINERKVKLLKLSIAFVQKIKYTVKTGYYEEECKVSRLRHSKLSNTVTESHKLLMTVPNTVPSSIHNNDPMIKISYVLRVHLKFSSFHSALYCKDIPVTVTTIPVMHMEF